MLNFQDGEILEESRSREIRANTPKWESGPDTTRSKAFSAAISRDPLPYSPPTPNLES
jgi:hypothetical protein